jgi:hypothetical protein
MPDRRGVAAANSGEEKTVRRRNAAFAGRPERARVIEHFPIFFCLARPGRAYFIYEGFI